MESDKIATDAPGSDGLQYHSKFRYVPVHRGSDTKGLSPSVNEVHPSRSRNPWGLGPAAFGFLVFFATAIVVGGAVGGGVASISKTTSVTQTATTTLTPTSFSSTLANYIAPAPTLVSHIPNACPGIDGQETNLHLDSGTYSFRVACDTDINAHGAADATTGQPVEDLVALYAYTLDGCLLVCMNYAGTNANGTVCKGVSWCHEMAFCVNKFGANCWLKSGSNAGTKENFTIAAVLQT